jgi:negative regulator of flagellin synthesis FlgM
MRIADAYRNSPANLNGTKTAATTAANGPAKAEESSANPSGAPPVKVTVSAEARRLADEAKGDEARVDRLRQAVAEGSFRVDTRAVAKKIVETGG